MAQRCDMAIDNGKVDELLDTIQSLSEGKPIISGNGHAVENVPQKRSAEDVEMEVDGAKKYKRKFKKMKVVKPFVLKNALMKLNESFPGLEYVVENMGGPPHQPIFKASVVVESQNFVGEGKSKQLAKLAAAVLALRYL